MRASCWTAVKKIVITPLEFRASDCVRDRVRLLEPDLIGGPLRLGIAAELPGRLVPWGLAR
jgi:hypothetical protein